jgi:formyl-CoA transferase
VRLPRGPARFDGEPTPVGAVPAIGEHTLDVLRDLLGRSDDEIAELARDGIVSFPNA